MHATHLLKRKDLLSPKTTMPSTSEPSTGSPIGRVPYDILREIFIHCLPLPGYYPHSQVQPDRRIAPILLCRICSSWRMVALAAAPLWTHLVFSFNILIGDDYYDVGAASRKFKFFAREIEFIRWWRTK
ncbi:hypothetical protein BJ912DRAFT_988863 [Pholiota molesta]|nr:hypothetical protein BJ912DRAFT_988863 [Pholiota molesta]